MGLGAGILIFLYLKLFIVPQNALTKSNYWDPNFIPHSGVREPNLFRVRMARGFITGTFTGSDMPWLPELLSPRYSWILSVAFGLLLCIGIVVASRSQRGRTLLIGIGGSLGLTVIASYIRYWPFGFVRTNYYLVPLLILLAGIGADGATKSFYEHPGKACPDHSSAEHHGGHRRGPHGSRARCRWSGSDLRNRHLQAGSRFSDPRCLWSEHWLRRRRCEKPCNTGSALVVGGPLAVQGWQYYQYEYTGGPSKTGSQIPPEHAVFLSGQDPPAVSRLIKRTEPNQVFLYVAYGAPGIQADIQAINSARSCRQVSQHNFVVSGYLITFDCSSIGALPHH